MVIPFTIIQFFYIQSLEKDLINLLEIYLPCVLSSSWGT